MNFIVACHRAAFSSFTIKSRFVEFEPQLVQQQPQIQQKQRKPLTIFNLFYLLTIHF